MVFSNKETGNKNFLAVGLLFFTHLVPFENQQHNHLTISNNGKKRKKK